MRAGARRAGSSSGELVEQPAHARQRGVEPEHVEHERGELAPAPIASAERRRFVEQLVEAGDDREPQHAQRVELARSRRAAGRPRGRYRRDAPLEHAGDVEQPARPAVCRGAARRAGRRCRRASTPRRRRGGRRTTTAGRPTGRPSRASAAACSATDTRRLTAAARRATSSPSRRDDPSAVGFGRRVVVRRSATARPRTPIRQRSSGGVMTVVTSTTSSSAPYSSSSSTPWARPMLAKISPTSPRGIIPIPTSSRSARVPVAPNADTSLPATATTSSTAAVEQDARPEHRAEVGVDADQHEEDRDAARRRSLPRSSAMRSWCSLRPMARPAMKAPMMNASWAASASIGEGRATMHERGDHERRARARARDRSSPAAGARTSSPTTPGRDEEAEGEAERAGDRRRPSTESPVTTLTTTVRMISPSTSSATAAPSTIRASVVASARRSPNTRAVMPTLVAVSAAPRKIAVSVSTPEADAGDGAADERHDDADDGDEHRRPTDLAQLGEVHLHADLHEQQQHAELGEHARG